MIENKEVNESFDTFFGKIKNSEEFYTIILFVASKISFFLSQLRPQTFI